MVEDDVSRHALPVLLSLAIKLATWLANTSNHHKYIFQVLLVDTFSFVTLQQAPQLLEQLIVRLFLRDGLLQEAHGCQDGTGMLERDLLGDIPVLLVAFNVIEYLAILSLELLANNLRAFLVHALLLCLFNLLLFVGLDLFELHRLLVLELMANLVQGFLDGLASVRAGAGGVMTLRDHLINSLTALSERVDNLVALLIELCFKHVNLLDAEDGVALAPEDRTR